MSETPGRAYRKRPVTVEAVRWTGSNINEIYGFTGRENFDALDEQDRANCDDPEATATVFDKLHSTWVLVYDGQWIIKGVKGEFYPCAADVFEATYEPASEPLGEVKPRPGEPGWFNVTCGICGAEHGTNMAVEEIACPECEARRCPHCRTWFGGEIELLPDAESRA